MALAGSGRALPAASISNDDLSQRVATNDTWIRSRTGIGARRVAGPGETVTSLAATAGLAALEQAGWRQQGGAGEVALAEDVAGVDARAVVTAGDQLGLLDRAVDHLTADRHRNLGARVLLLLEHQPNIGDLLQRRDRSGAHQERIKVPENGVGAGGHQEARAGRISSRLATWPRRWAPELRP